MGIIIKMTTWSVMILFTYALLQHYFGLKPGRKLSIYFGLPGSGKTTFAAYLVKKQIKKLNKKQKKLDKCINKNSRYAKKLAKWIEENKNLYSNIAIKEAYKMEKEDIGQYDIINGRLIIDEVGIEYNNRNYKAFPKKAISYFKLHRHYKTDIDVFSQSHEDCDVTLRRLAQKYYVIKRSIIPGFITKKEIKRKIGINELTHQIEDRYYFAFLGVRWIFCPPLWKYFDTEEAPELQHKNWEKWKEATYKNKKIGDLIA